MKDHLGNVRLVFSDMKDVNFGQVGRNRYKLDIRSVNNYYPFGMLMHDMSWQSAGYRYGFGGHEMDNDVKGTGNHSSFGDYGYDPRTVRRYMLEPMIAKYPSLSPYVAYADNPIYLTDPSGQEPVSSFNKLNPWFKLKPTQWYSTAGYFYDNETFNLAAAYCTINLKSDAYQSVYQRNAYYGWVQSQSDKIGNNSKWFGAANIIAGLNAVGATELPNVWVIKDNTESFLKGGNKFLFPYNMKNAKDLLTAGKISGSFVDANGVEQSFDGLSGIDLDNKLVEFEQSKIQEYINNYQGNDLKSINDNINELFNGIIATTIGPGVINDIMKEHFDGGKSFNFINYEDRVKLGQEMVKKAHNE